ncbi:MAG TPA: macro domain-containing protein [Candidatus Dormibacteraeota bacterium]|nr:macro domain-containing protein [Candidatus Dormibacteraeota bacterium]
MAGEARELPAGAGRITVERADVTTLDVDAVVNAANAQLAGGGGVDGAIHRAAGAAALQEELHRRHPGGCPTGSAVITSGHRLRARHIVHAVGPRWSEGRAEECDVHLRSAYGTAFALAAAEGCASVAAPSISTGIYGFPIERAAPIAVAAAREALEQPGTPLREVRFALFSDADLDTFSRALEAAAS